MRRNRWAFMAGLIFLVLIFAVSCGQKEATPGTSQSTPEQTSSENKPPKAEQNEFLSEKYGFAFIYGDLILDDKVDGDRFAELKHVSGDSATVSIMKPDPMIGDDPEKWLMNSFKTSDYKIIERKELKLGKYPALLAEYSWNVLGKPIRTIDLTAYKDGYFFSLIVTMREENVEAERPEFDQVVESFMLLDNTIDLDALKPWKENIPKDYPFEVMDLFGLSELTSVFGKTVSEPGGLAVLYDVDEAINYEDTINFFKETLKDAPDFDLSPHEDSTEISGTKAGYEFEVKVRYYKIMEKTTVTLNVKK